MEHSPRRPATAASLPEALYPLVFEVSVGSFLFNHTRGQNHTIAVVVQFEREDQDVPVPAVGLRRQMRQSAKAPVYISLARIGYGADDVSPLGAEFRKFVEHVLPLEPVFLLLVQPRKVLVGVEPVPIAVENLQHYVVAHGHGYARVEEVPCIHHHRLAPALGLERMEGRQQVIDRAVAFQQVHVFNPAELPFECGRENDNGNLRALVPKRLRDFRAEFPRAQMVVENGYIDVFQVNFSFFDRSAGDCFITLPAKDSRAEDEVVLPVIQQQYPNWFLRFRLTRFHSNDPYQYAALSLREPVWRQNARPWPVPAAC